MCSGKWMLEQQKPITKAQEGKRDRTVKVKRGRQEKTIQIHQIEYTKYIYRLYSNGDIA